MAGKYVGKSAWQRVDLNTGTPIYDEEGRPEIRLCDEIEADPTKHANGFMITYMSAILSLIDRLGTKKMAVVKYIFSNMSKSENTLIITTAELADKAKVSKPVVLQTLKILTEAGLIKRRTGAIMISAQLMHRGNGQRERYLMAKFNEFSTEATPPKKAQVIEMPQAVNE